MHATGLAEANIITKLKEICNTDNTKTKKNPSMMKINAYFT